MNKKTILYLIISTILFSCMDEEINEEVQLNQIFVSYYPSRTNYDFDSIRISTKDALKIDTVFASYNADLKREHADRYETQKLVLSKPDSYRNTVYHGRNKPFVWEETRVNSFDVSLDSVRRYLKMVILNKTNFSIYSKEKGYQKLKLTDTSSIVLKELYGEL